MIEFIYAYKILIAALVAGGFGLVTCVLGGWFGNYRATQTLRASDKSETRQQFVAMNAAITDDYKRELHKNEELRKTHAEAQVEWDAREISLLSKIKELTERLEGQTA